MLPEIKDKKLNTRKDRGRERADLQVRQSLAAPCGSQGIRSDLTAPREVCWRGLGAPFSSASTFWLARGVQISQGPKQKGSSLQNVSRETNAVQVGFKP